MRKRATEGYTDIGTVANTLVIFCKNIILLYIVKIVVDIVVSNDMVGFGSYWWYVNLHKFDIHSKIHP